MPTEEERREDWERQYREEHGGGEGTEEEWRQHYERVFGGGGRGGEGGGGGEGEGWEGDFRRSRDEWEQATRRSGEWDRWNPYEREQEFARHAQRLGYGSREDLEDYLAGRSPDVERNPYDEMMGRLARGQEARQGGLYQVQPGDTLSGVAQRFGLQYEDLLRWNPRRDPNLIRVGEVLRIPGYDQAPTPPPQPTQIPIQPGMGGFLGRPPSGQRGGQWVEEVIPMPSPLADPAAFARWVAGAKTRPVYREAEEELPPYRAGGAIGPALQPVPTPAPRLPDVVGGAEIAPSPQLPSWLQAILMPGGERQAEQELEAAQQEAEAAATFGGTALTAPYEWVTRPFLESLVAGAPVLEGPEYGEVGRPPTEEERAMRLEWWRDRQPLFQFPFAPGLPGIGMPEEGILPTWTPEEIEAGTTTVSAPSFQDIAELALDPWNLLLSPRVLQLLPTLGRALPGAAREAIQAGRGGVAGLRGLPGAAREVAEELVPGARRLLAGEAGAVGPQQAARLRIRAGTSQGQEGFILSGTDTQGRRVDVFAPSRQEAEGLRAALKRGEDPWAVPSVPEAVVKEPWQMTRAEFAQGKSLMQRRNESLMPISNPRSHYAQIVKAIQEGKPVPPEVRAEWLDLPTARATPRAGLVEGGGRIPEGGVAKYVTDADGKIARVIRWQEDQPIVVYPGKTGGLTPSTGMPIGEANLPRQYRLTDWKPVTADDFSKSVRPGKSQAMLDLRQWRDDFAQSQRRRGREALIPLTEEVMESGRRRILEARIRRGEPVPPAMLEEFPDLAARAPRIPEAGVAPTEVRPETQAGEWKITGKGTYSPTAEELTFFSNLARYVQDAVPDVPKPFSLGIGGKISLAGDRGINLAPLSGRQAEALLREPLFVSKSNATLLWTLSEQYGALPVARAWDAFHEIGHVRGLKETAANNWAARQTATFLKRFGVQVSEIAPYALPEVTPIVPRVAARVPEAGVAPPDIIPQDLSTRLGAILEPPPSQITPELAEEIRRARLESVAPRPPEAPRAGLVEEGGRIPGAGVVEAVEPASRRAWEFEPSGIGLRRTPGYFAASPPPPATAIPVREDLARAVGSLIDSLPPDIADQIEGVRFVGKEADIGYLLPSREIYLKPDKPFSEVVRDLAHEVGEVFLGRQEQLARLPMGVEGARRHRFVDDFAEWLVTGRAPRNKANKDILEKGFAAEKGLWGRAEARLLTPPPEVKVGQTVRVVFNGREFEGTVGSIRTTKAGTTLAFPEGTWANGSKRGIPVEGKNVQWFERQLDDAVETLERQAAEAGATLTEIPAPLAGAGGGKGGRHRGPPPPRPGGVGAPTGGTQGGLPGAAADLLFGYPGEPNQRAIGRQFGGQRTAAFLRITAEGREGQNVLAQAMEETGQKAIRRAGDRDFNGVVFDNDDLMRALHGEGPVPEGYERFYDWERAAVKAEEDRMVLVDPDFSRYIEANPDYFYRAWQLPKDANDWPTAWRRLGFGDEPGFLKERVKPSYTQMREWGFEPLSRNPVDMVVLRRIAGEERRLLLVTRQKLEAGRLIMPASQAPEGWRVPRNIGTLFTGTAEQPAMAVPNYVANVLERVFHVRPSGKGWTIVKAVVDFQDSVKQYKFLGSLFQHFDMLFRAGYVASTLTGIRNLAPLKYIPLGTRLMTVRALKSSQRALKREIMSDVALYDDFPITGAMLVEEGLNLRGDPTMLARPMLENYQAVLAQGGTPPGWAQLAKARGDSVKNFTVDWLFEGVYPESQWWSLKNFVIPRLRTIHPKWTPRQIAGLAAAETNKMFSTIAPFQSWFKSPEAFEASRLFLFSGELEAWTRQAASMFRGPAKRLWGEYHLGMYIFLAAVANVLNFWAEGEFIPLEDYFPVKVGDKFSPWPGGVAYNTRWFAPKIAGAVGEAGRPLYLDIVGQADTVLRWVADPVDASLSRTNVFWQAARRQLEGETFWGKTLGTLQERAGALLQDIAGPIGPSNIGDVLRQLRPDLPPILPASGEPRIGITGGLIQATGFNVRAETNARMLDSVANQFYPGKTWKELTRAERNRRDFAQRTAPYLMPSGDPDEYADSLVGRIDRYWDAYNTTIEDFRQRRQAIPIGQKYDEQKAYQEQTRAIDALKQRLGLTDDDLFGERPPAPRGPNLLDLGRYLINLFQKPPPPVAPAAPEKPDEEAQARALASSPDMLRDWLKGQPIGIPPGEESISTKNYIVMGRPQEEFNANEKQLFPMLSRVYGALYDAARDPNGVFDEQRFLVLQQEFLRNVPDPLENRWQEWRERNKTPGEMVRDIYGEYVAQYYADNEGKTSQERQQWIAQNPPPAASFIAATVLNRWGHRFTTDSNEVDHPAKWDWNDLSEALAGLNIPNIDEYHERRSAQRVKELQETGQPFYSSSGVLVQQNNLEEYLLAQGQLDEYMNWLETRWRPAAGLRAQRDALTARIDRLYDERNVVYDNPDISLEERQRVFVEAKEQIDTLKEQREAIRNRLPTYQNAPPLVVKYFFGPPDAEERERLKQLPPEVRAQMVEREAVPRGGFGGPEPRAVTVAKIFETMPTADKGATSEEISAWWDANEPRLKELGWRQEPYKEEVGRIFETMPDFGEEPTREQKAILSKWWDDNKPRLLELGWTPKWESQVVDLAREWWDERRKRGEATDDLDALAAHLEGIGMGDKENLRAYMVGPGADDLEKSFIWSEYFALRNAGRNAEAAQYFSQKKARLKELGWKTTPEQDEIDKIFDEYNRLKATEGQRAASRYYKEVESRLRELGYVPKGEQEGAAAPRVTPTPTTGTGGLPPMTDPWWDYETTQGSEAWRDAFERIHNRPPNNIDYYIDYLWSQRYHQATGRAPSRADWERHYNQGVRYGERPRSQAPEFNRAGTYRPPQGPPRPPEKSLTNTQWDNLQKELGPVATRDLMGSRFAPDLLTGATRNMLQRYYRQHPYGASSFDAWLLMTKRAFQREMGRS